MKELVAAAAAVALSMGTALPAGNASPTDADAGTVASAGTPSHFSGPDSVFNRDRIGLSAAQERALWQGASGMAPQDLPPHVVAFPGARLPKATELADIPAGVRDEAGGDKLNDYRMARVDAGVAIVDPSDNTVQAVVTLQEGTGRALAPSGAPVRTLDGAAVRADPPRIDNGIAFNETPIAEQKPPTLGTGSARQSSEAPARLPPTAD